MYYICNYISIFPHQKLLHFPTPEIVKFFLAVNWLKIAVSIFVTFFVNLLINLFPLVEIGSLLPQVGKWTKRNQDKKTLCYPVLGEV